MYDERKFDDGTRNKAWVDWEQATGTVFCFSATVNETEEAGIGNIQ